MLVQNALSLKLENLEDNHYKIRIEICNNAQKDYYIKKYVLLLDGFTHNNIKITSGPSHINCGIATKHHDSDFFLLRGASCISNILNVEDLCNFNEALNGTYTLQYNTDPLLCPQPAYHNCDISTQALTGEISLLHGEQQ